MLNKGLNFVFIEQMSICCYTHVHTISEGKCTCSWTCIHWMYSLYIKFDYILLVTEASDIKLSLVLLWT